MTEWLEEPDWRDDDDNWREAEIPPEITGTARNIAEIAQKMELRSVRYEVYVPFSCDPNKKFKAGEIYEGPGRYWHIEGQDGKFNDPENAIYRLMERLEISRQAMLNKEFEMFNE